MSKQLPIGSLPLQVREQLEALLQREPAALEPKDLAFLRARRDYLSSDQRKYYGTDKPVPKNEGTGEGEGDGQGFDRNAAKARLKELGVQFSGNAKNEVLAELLAKAEAEAAEGGEGDE